MARRHELLLPGKMVGTVNLGMDYVLAGGAKDGVEQDGGWVAIDNRFGLQVAAHYAYTLAATETFTLAFNLQDATDASGTGAADFGTAFAATVIDTGVDTDVHGVTKVHESLERSRAFIRIQRTSTLSAATTDFVVIGFAATFSEETSPVA